MSRRLAVLALCLSLPLGGCLTPRARPAPSAAITAARAGAGVKPAACQVGKLEDLSPVAASFPFDDATLDPEGARRIGQAAAWLTCNAGVPVVIVPTADHHGDAAHQKDLAARRAQATLAALRAAGAASAVVHSLALGAPDPVTGPHVVVNAAGRGW